LILDDFLFLVFNSKILECVNFDSVGC
jgi:hypothetical protein